ncbi:hypothetical protein PFISCL1PPCAC_7106, partial [Pristionchus fissidentatus]
MATHDDFEKADNVLFLMMREGAEDSRRYANGTLTSSKAMENSLVIGTTEFFICACFILACLAAVAVVILWRRTGREVLNKEIIVCIPRWHQITYFVAECSHLRLHSIIQSPQNWPTPIIFNLSHFYLLSPDQGSIKFRVPRVTMRTYDSHEYNWKSTKKTTYNL